MTSIPTTRRSARLSSNPTLTSVTVNLSGNSNSGGIGIGSGSGDGDGIGGMNNSNHVNITHSSSSSVSSGGIHGSSMIRSSSSSGGSGGSGSSSSNKTRRSGNNIGMISLWFKSCKQICTITRVLVAFGFCWMCLIVMLFVVTMQHGKTNEPISNPSITNNQPDPLPIVPIIPVSQGNEKYVVVNGKLVVLPRDKVPDFRHVIQPNDIMPPPKGPPVPMRCDYEGPKPGYLPGCAEDNCANMDNLESAKEKCNRDELCTGIVKLSPNANIYQLRGGMTPDSSPSGEVSWIKTCVKDNVNPNNLPGANKNLERNGSPNVNIPNKNHMGDRNHMGDFNPMADVNRIGELKANIDMLGLKLKQQLHEQNSSLHKMNPNLKQEIINPKGCWMDGPLKGFLTNCADDNCANYPTLEIATKACLMADSCGGVVQMVANRMYQMRRSTDLQPSDNGQIAYLKRCGVKPMDAGVKKAVPITPQCVFTGPHKGHLGNCANDECKRYFFYEDAKDACLKEKNCMGITRLMGLRQSFELRASTSLSDSEVGEYSYLKVCGDPSVTAAADPFGESITRYELIGSKVNDLPTIYVGVASYRDDLCKNSVYTAFSRAKFPERVYVGVVQQNLPEDPECVVPEQPCEKDPTQIFCKWKDHIRIKKIDARDAAGPTFGRHHADMLYRQEYFAVQVDAHMSFIRNWDEVAINQWKTLGNEYAILTTYPSEVAYSMDEQGNSKVSTAPLICQTRMLASGMFKHEAAGEIMFPDTHKDKPLLEPFLGAGVVFSRGHRIVRVPYDCCLPMVFDGEEFSLGIRSWTHGYDLYAPCISFAFHPYQRQKRPPMFWEQPDNGRQTRSENRIKAIMGMPVDGDYDRTDLERYGLGTVRPLQKYLDIFGINLETKQTKNLCEEAFSGALHDRLHAFLRRDGRGIDYNNVYIPPPTPQSQNLDKRKSNLKRKRKEPRLDN